MPDKYSNPTPFNTLASPYADTYTSVSGSDIVGVVGHVEFVNLQGVSVSVNREIHPIYVMGRTDPISFVRGKRGIAGSLVSVCFDRGSLYDIIELYGVYARKKGDNRPGANGPTEGFDNVLSESALANANALGFELATPNYYDQLPPFDVTLVGRSEAATATVSRIGGVFIVSMGTGMSVDDNSIEQQMTFVALFYEDWRPAGRYGKVAGQDRVQEYNAFRRDQQGVDTRITDRVDDDLGTTFGLQGVTPPTARNAFGDPVNGA